MNDNPSARMAEAMAQFTDVLGPVRDAVVGYRATLISAGINELHADEMATDAHRLITTVITANMVKSST